MRRRLLSLLVLLLAAARLEAAELRLMGERFDPLSSLPQQLLPPTPPDGGLVLLQHRSAPDLAWRRGLEALGGEVLDYVPEDAFLVWLPAGQASAARALPGTRALVALVPALKLTPDLRRARAGSAPLRLSLTLRRPPDLEPVLARLAASGFVLDHRFARLGQELLRGRASGPDIAALAADPDVISLSLWQDSQLDGEVAKRIIDGSQGSGPDVRSPGYLAFLAGKGADGSGVTVAVIDNGVDSSDPSGHLTGRVLDLLRGSTAGSNGHGHHVAGIVAGSCGHPPDPAGYLWGLGVAPAAHLLNIPRLRAGYTGTDLEQVRDAVRTPAANGVAANIAACSWNVGLGGDYTADERLWDSFVRDADDLAPGNQELFVSFSAGNAGPSPGSLTRPHAGKNVLAVGNSVSYRPADGFDDFNEMYSGAGGSSRGPAADGRIKPELVAPGTFIAAADSGFIPSDCSPAIDGVHIFCTGTSMAQPHAAGAAALLTDWWRRARGTTPSPALLRAMLVNGTRDLRPVALGPPFSTPPIPNFDEGYGLLDLGASLAPALAALVLDQTDTLRFTAPGQSETREFVPADPARPLRATLAWTDAPAAVGADPALVNDLDLRLETGSLVYRGNAFSGGVSDPTLGAADRLNPTEAVRIERPADGLWRVTVDAARIVGDGVPGNADPLDQDWTLVLGNALVASRDGGVRIVGARHACGASLELLVWDTDPSASVTVQAASTSEPAGESVTLISTGGAFFRGTIALAGGPAAPDGRLQVADGDRITLTYVDADDGKGGIGVVKTSTALADCRGPVISNVRVSSLTDTTAVIEWDTDEPAASEVELVAGATLRVSDPSPVVAHAVMLAGLGECGRYRFVVRSADAAGNTTLEDNLGQGHPLATWARDAVFATSFEGDDGGFTHMGPLEEWQWGWPLEGAPAPSTGDRCWGTDLRGKYAKGGRNDLNGSFVLLSPPIDLGGRSGTRLRFAHWFDIATDGSTDDGAWVEAWDGSAWSFLTPLGGYGGSIDADAPLPAGATGAAWQGRSGGWRTAEFDLAAFDGRLVYLKLTLFEEDDFLAGAPGWYIDDFEVFGFATCERARLRLLEPAASCGRPLTLEVRDSGLNRDPALAESASARLVSGLEPQGERVDLFETGANTSLFQASFPVAGDPGGGNGSIGTQSGDRITASYLDLDDGSGRSVSRAASIPADCAPPRLSAVAVSALTDRSALLTWSSDEPATSRVEFGTTSGLGRAVDDRTLGREHSVLLLDLTPCTTYFFRVSSADVAGGLAVDDNRGALHRFTTWTGDGVAFADDFETDRGWTLDGEWERDRPDGAAFATPNSMDPNAAVSRTNVLGIDLTGRGIRKGDYEAGVALETATSPPIDCSGLSRVELGFRRWLGVERATGGDRATIEVSGNGGGSWSSVFSNDAAADTNDRLWREASFDVTAIAAGRADVRVRFTLGSNSSLEFMGWQIDDLVVRDPARRPHRPCGSGLELVAATVDDSTGNANGVADPGEMVTLQVRLANPGPLLAQSVSGSLSTGRPDLALVAGASSAFAAIPPGGTADSLAPHFALDISPAARCGEALPLTLDLASLDARGVAALTLPIGNGSRRSQTVASPTTPLSLPDQNPMGLEMTLAVAESEPLLALEVTVAAAHPDAGDVVVTLEAPDGNQVVLHNLSDGGQAYPGAVYPTGRVEDGPGRLASFLGRSPRGTWKMRVIDARRNSLGTWSGFSVKTTVLDPASSVLGPVSAPLLLARLGADVSASYGLAPGAVSHVLRKSAYRSLPGAVVVGVRSGLETLEPGGALAGGSWYYDVRGVDGCGREGP